MRTLSLERLQTASVTFTRNVKCKVSHCEQRWTSYWLFLVSATHQVWDIKSFSVNLVRGRALRFPASSRGYPTGKAGVRRSSFEKQLHPLPSPLKCQYKIYEKNHTTWIAPNLLVALELFKSSPFPLLARSFTKCTT